MNNPKYIILHTAAHGKGNVDYDTSAVDIDQWHKARGWKGIGYHFVIRKNGTIERGRDVTVEGAHAKGINSESLGICFSGHGDISPWTDEQTKSCMNLCKQLMTQYNIPVEKVMGHREVNRIPGAEKTTKTCPGTKISMENVRQMLADESGKKE